MNQNNTADNQKQKRNIPQNWKVGVATALGLVGGAGAVYAAEVISNDNVLSPEEAAQEAVEDTAAEQTAADTQAAAEQTAQANHPHHVVEVTHVEHHVHEHPAHDPKPHPVAGNDPGNDPGHGPNSGLPNYTIVEEGIVDTEDGGQAHVAFGYTEDGHLCAVIDGDMDGLGDVFFVDVNDDQNIEESELINLHEANITVQMEELPIIPVEEPPVEDPLVDVGEPQNDDELIGQLEGDDKLPDYTQDENVLSQNDDEPENYPEPEYEPDPMDTQNYMADTNDTFDATEVMTDPVDVV